MKRTLKTEAIVLRKRPLPNQDKIITLLTKELGKVTALAKGIKKITSRRLPHIQTANLINVILYKRNDRFYLQETFLISAFQEIKKNADKIEFFYTFFFILDRLLPENQKETEVYIVTKQFLIRLSRTIVPDTRTLTRYLNKLLSLLGYLNKEKSMEELQSIIEDLISEKMPQIQYSS